MYPDDGKCRSIAPDVRLGRNARLAAFVNLSGRTIGDDARAGAFVEVRKNAAAGARCEIGSHGLVCAGAVIAGALVGAGAVVAGVPARCLKTSRGAA